jgi:hypothetical protein
VIEVAEKFSNSLISSIFVKIKIHGRKDVGQGTAGYRGLQTGTE